MKIIKVVCGIIWKDDKVFIARRKPEKSLGGYWEFPGGKIEENEDPEAALIRELNEELGMKVTIKEFIAQKTHNYENFTIDLIAYKCEFISVSNTLTDHDKWGFVIPKELTMFKIAPADLFILEKI